MTSHPKAFIRLPAFGLLICLFMTSCTTPGGQPATKTYGVGTAMGAILGGAIGAGLGALSGDKDGAVKGLIIGSAAGALVGFGIAHQQALKRDYYASRFDTVNSDLARARSNLSAARKNQSALESQLENARVSQATLSASQQSLKQVRSDRKTLTEALGYVPVKTSAGTEKSREVKAAIRRLDDVEKSLQESLRRAEKRVSE